jgi:hypothetical protein
MRHWSKNREPQELDSDLLAAINATDTWIDDNTSAYNSTLPAAAQSGLSTKQKALLFSVVALARVSNALLRKLIGEVN